MGDKRYLVRKISESAAEEWYEFKVDSPEEAVEAYAADGGDAPGDLFEVVFCNPTVYSIGAHKVD